MNVAEKAQEALAQLVASCREPVAAADMDDGQVSFAGPALKALFEAAPSLDGDGRARLQDGFAAAIAELPAFQASRLAVIVGALVEQGIEAAAPGAELVHYIRAGATVAIFTKTDDANPATPDKTRYLHKDHLGSLTLLTKEDGTVAERRSFDPHGKQRGDDWTAGGTASGMAETRRGFTGHEHIDTVGLIHMNGRVYDPETGRFLSADPFVQTPENLQSFNRYTYVNNNPLSATDPSGFFFKKIFKAIVKWISKNWQSLVQIVLAAIPTVGIFLAAAFTGIMTAVNGGSITDAFMAAGLSLASSAAFAGLHAFQPVSVIGKIAKVAAHGAVGGVLSKLRGGSFKSGFLSSAAVQGFTQAGGFKAVGLDAGKAPQDLGERLKNATVSAVVGGTSSVIGGGKFANGAVTGAFSRLFNDMKARPALTNEDLKELGPLAGRYADRVLTYDNKEFLREMGIDWEMSSAEIGARQQDIRP